MLTTKWTPADMPMQGGRLAIVTGATSGLGFQAALALAGAGAGVVLAAHDPGKGERAMAAIRRRHPGAKLEFRELDTARLGSIREFANEWKKDGRSIDILLLNAGISSVPKRETTEDGFERQFSTNYLGHFALTGLLLPSVGKSASSRIIEVASLAHKRTHLHFDDLQLERFYSAGVGYSQSKLAMLMFGFELDRRLQAAGCPIASIPVHPGVSSTDITRRGGRATKLQGLLAKALFGLVGQSPAHGAWPLLYAATSPDAKGGTYYGPGGFREFRGHPAVASVAPDALDREAASRLWSVSEDLSRVEFGL